VNVTGRKWPNAEVMAQPTRIRVGTAGTEQIASATVTVLHSPFFLGSRRALQCGVNKLFHEFPELDPG
jgi:hypothetical protein